MEDGIACGRCIMEKLAANGKANGKLRLFFCHACEEGGKAPLCAHGMGICSRQKS